VFVAKWEQDPMARNLSIVDADAHVNPPPGMWAEYLSPQYRERAPRIEHADDADYLLFEGNRRKLNLIAAFGPARENYRTEGRLSDALTGGWMPQARLDDMDKDGIDAAVIFGGGPLATGDYAFFVDSFEAYNGWLADFVSYAPDRLTGIGYVPMRDVETTVRMMKRCAEIGFTAVNLPAFPQRLDVSKNFSKENSQMLTLTGDPEGGRTYSDPEFDPIWQTACDLGLAITIHLGGRPSRFNQKDKFLADLPMSKLSMAEPIAILIYGGVFDRFPDLKFVSVESGVGWFAWFTEYMNRTWSMQRHWVGNTIEHEPGYYMDRNVYGTFIRDVVGVRNRDLPGGKNIMWTSDYPHSETTFPNSRSDIDLHFVGVPEDDKRMIICERARQLFRLDEVHRRKAA
jgi:predicted TIM-barrel fold metal-dependent hydrolase